MGRVVVQHSVGKVLLRLPRRKAMQVSETAECVNRDVARPVASRLREVPPGSRARAVALRLKWPMAR